MYVDVVAPNSNEKEFISMSHRLGFSSVYFFEKKFENIPQVSLYPKNNGSLIIAKSSEHDREMLECKEIDALYLLEGSSRKDFMHHRASGLNHTLCEIAKKNNKIIIFSFNSILESVNKPLTLGRVQQNIMICRKYKVPIAIASFAKNPYQMRSPHDLVSFFCTLGMARPEASEALETLRKRIKQKGSFHSEGIHIID